ncbi:hypothetical protein CWATWH0402_3004 [Crocosphaera watsonii WH 0402]|uniref:Uncharacterized protein n=1 Tax=Crocosphaera watsonii WH 0402 TaxID=1284629 RepID=T2JMB9_CROWT|nr:hypothetical protein CWATWH0402_3004 [Crocosphaera watsonii WH 0402]
MTPVSSSPEATTMVWDIRETKMLTPAIINRLDNDFIGY